MPTDIRGSQPASVTPLPGYGVEGPEIADALHRSGWYHLYVPDRGEVPVEFSATANVLPARHLSVLIPPDKASAEEAEGILAREAAWAPVVAERSGRSELTEREREVMTLVASGLQTGDIAERLFLAPETVKSHVQNAMGKLGAHTRAHAVAIALTRAQIVWDM